MKPEVQLRHLKHVGMEYVNAALRRGNKIMTLAREQKLDTYPLEDIKEHYMNSGLTILRLVNRRPSSPQGK